MNHGAGLPAPPAFEERTHRGPRFDRAKPVQIELGICPRIEQLVARIERGMPASPFHLRCFDPSNEWFTTLSGTLSPCRSVNTALRRNPRSSSTTT